MHDKDNDLRPLPSTVRNPRASPRLRAFVRAQRALATPAERQLWGALRRRQLLGAKFRRQFPVGNRFVVDFYCHAARLVIEVDGDYHENTIERDHARQCCLQSRGYTVLRFHNSRVYQELSTVLSEIEAVLRERLQL